MMTELEDRRTSNTGSDQVQSRSIMSTTNTSTSPFRKLSSMWHPHVYGQAPKCPTPFSIEDILSRQSFETRRPGFLFANGGGSSLGGDSPRGQSPVMMEDDESKSASGLTGMVLEQPLNLTTKKTTSSLYEEQCGNKARGESVSDICLSVCLRLKGDVIGP